MPRVNNVNYTVNYNFFLEHVFAIGSRAYFQQPKCSDIEGATAFYSHSFKSKALPASSSSSTDICGLERMVSEWIVGTFN